MQNIWFLLFIWLWLQNATIFAIEQSLDIEKLLK